MDVVHLFPDHRSRLQWSPTALAYSAEVAQLRRLEACPPSPRLRHAAHRLWPTGRRTPAAHSSIALSILRSSLLWRTGSCGFLRRRVKMVGLSVTCEGVPGYLLPLSQIRRRRLLHLRLARRRGPTLVDQLRPASGWRCRCSKFRSGEARNGTSFGIKQIRNLVWSRRGAGAGGATVSAPAPSPCPSVTPYVRIACTIRLTSIIHLCN